MSSASQHFIYKHTYIYANIHIYNIYICTVFNIYVSTLLPAFADVQDGSYIAARKGSGLNRADATTGVVTGAHVGILKCALKLGRTRYIHIHFCQF